MNEMNRNNKKHKQICIYYDKNTQRKSEKEEKRKWKKILTIDV